MKTLYVPKGKTLHYERLECQTIIADGTPEKDCWMQAPFILPQSLFGILTQ